jgi:polysaccharide export outer membrane protein
MWPLLALCVSAQAPLTAGFGSTSETTAAAPLDAAYQPHDPLSTSITSARALLGPGDLLEINVFDTPELSQRVRVDSDGNITLALLGEMSVRDMTSVQLERKIAGGLITGRFVRKPHVSVFVAGFAGQVAYVTGEVNRPGAYPLMRSHRLRDLVAVAGGPTAKAGNLATIVREGDKPETLQANLNGAESEQDNPEILPGDRITVDHAGIVYVLGKVGRPGGFLIDRHNTVTVLKALSLAEGLQSSASINKATLLRKTDDGNLEIAINIEEILKGKSPDLAVRDGDILYINGSFLRGLGRETFTTILGTASTAAIYLAAR